MAEMDAVKIADGCGTGLPPHHGTQFFRIVRDEHELSACLLCQGHIHSLGKIFQ